MTLNPNDSYLQKQIDQLRDLLYAVQSRSLSVEKGRTRYYGGSELLIEDSNFRVQGTAYTSGRQEGDGTFAWSGPVYLDGPVEITETLRVLAATTLEALTRILGDLVVDGGKIESGDVRIEDGKVYIGDMVLDPSIAGGAMTFPNGSQVFTDGSTIQVYLGNSVVQVADGYAKLQHGGDVIEINGTGIRLSPGAIPDVAGTGLPAGTLVLISGYLRQSDGS